MNNLRVSKTERKTIYDKVLPKLENIVAETQTQLRVYTFFVITDIEMYKLRVFAKNHVLACKACETWINKKGYDKASYELVSERDLMAFLIETEKT